MVEFKDGGVCLIVPSKNICSSFSVPLLKVTLFRNKVFVDMIKCHLNAITGILIRRRTFGYRHSGENAT
jgi:hypothetical protein